MILPTFTNVLIVGTGPAGLACAISLAVNGYKDVTIVDARPSGRTLSRAIVIHAQTLEELDTVGCADTLNTRGLHAKYMTVRAQKTLLAKANFPSLAPRTRFPWALLISQAETEDILDQRMNELGIKILRPYNVTGMKTVEGGMQVQFESGEIIKARYVIGADGSRSTIRQLAGIPFRDPLTDQEPYVERPKGVETTKQLEKRLGKELVIADVHLSGPIPPEVNTEELSVFLSTLQFLLLVPLPALKDDPNGKTVYRMSCPAEPGSLEVTLPRLQTVLDSALGHLPAHQKPRVEKIIWSSNFRVKSAVADRFFTRIGDGVVALIGDAGHVHSPAGGQGMNLGIRDAIQLGRTLADILKREQNGTALAHAQRAYALQRLEQFSEERRKMAIQVIKMTKVMTWATGLETLPAQKARDVVWWLMGRGSFVNNRLALRLSGLQAGEQTRQPASAQQATPSVSSIETAIRSLLSKDPQHLQQGAGGAAIRLFSYAVLLVCLLLPTIWLRRSASVTAVTRA
ncbi:hypothetical protein CERSUDRAFT_48278 [Gelatoporia subvermispora B]|uniref:FAD-binding domain-containing protein n=1 Tax=Ceriporiopsis subvermispora (strain B) TaxID=914234 RepID=M2RHR7_CERS8|nr:hypothetical protein CERSUDRAFT_48278 [Gelatoporia subvermispora B]